MSWLYLRYFEFGREEQFHCKGQCSAFLQSIVIFSLKITLLLHKKECIYIFYPELSMSWIVIFKTTRSSTIKVFYNII